MASGQPRSPTTPSAIPKRSFPSFSVRRSSTSNVNAPITHPRASFSTPSITTAVAASPISTTNHASNSTTQSGVPAGSGIPALRSLRNLLPFGPPKQQTTTPATPSRGPFAGFGSMRKSMTASREKEKERERMSLSNETYMPVLSIERRLSQSQDDPPMRRSISLSHLEVNMDKPLPPPGPESKSFEHDEPVVLNPLPLLRLPSPGPPLLTELSTIMEADSSGISKHVPLLTPSPGSSSYSLSLPNSPNPEEHTIKRPLQPSATPLMTSSPLLPSTPTAHPPLQHTNSLHSPVPTDVGSPPMTETELELSTSQIISQVKDAMARTSWQGNDKAFVIDGDASFLQIHGSSEEDRGRSNGGHESDDTGEADDDASLLAIVDVKLGSRSSSSSSSSPRSYLMGEDDLSHVNNSVSSVVNPNELRATGDTTLDLGSLDPDLRAAVVNTTINRSFTSMTFRNPASPSSVGHSSTSGRTITLPSPPHPHPASKDMRQGTRSVSASSVPSTSPSAPKATAATPAKSHIQSTSSHKRRPASSFLPRLRSPPPYSAPVSAKNSPSPRKTSFDSPHTSGGTRRVTNSHINGIMTGGTSSPRSPVFATQQQQQGGGSSRVPSAGSAARIPSSTEFGGGLVSSTPMKVSSKPQQQKQGVMVASKRRSSVPVATWRYSRERGEGESDFDGEEVERPEVRVVEASGELDSNSTSSSQKRRSDGKLGAEGWSPNILFANKKLEDSPVLTSDVRLPHEGYGADGNEMRILGSPFHTPGGRRDKLGNGSHGASPSGRPYSFPSPSHSPSPSSVPLPTTHFESRSSTRDILAAPTVNDTITYPSTMINNQSLNPSLYIPPQSQSQSLNPSPLIPPSSADTAVFSRRGSSSGTDGEGSSPSRITDTGSLSGRPSRRLPAPLRMFWGGSTASNGSNTSGGGGSGGSEEKLMLLSERQPSPLRSVVRVDAFGREEAEEEGNHDRGGHGMRPSFDGSTTVSRPSMESARPSMESYIVSSSSVVSGSASMSVRRTPEPGYQEERHVVERSRPPTRLLVERARKRSMSVQEIRPEFDLMVSGRDSVGLGNASSATLSARERLARARYGDLGGGTRPVSSMSVRSSRTESLGVKNSTRGGRVAAGLLEFERERNLTLSGIERSVSERTGEKELVQYRERSGSASGIGTLGRYASLRSASEYNFAGGSASAVNLSMMQQTTSHPRPYSRIAFSEASGGSEHGRRGSGTFSAAGIGLMDSPTFTVSTAASGSRDTQRSSSTGATSVSQASMKEREREREELKELREKHVVETGALLNALSDSQRSCRVLREENGELRDKIADVESENERLRRIMGDLEMEVERLKYSRERERGWERTRLRERGWESGRNHRGLSASVGPGGGGWRGLATPVIKQRDMTLGHRTMPRIQHWPSYEQDSQGVQHHDEPELTVRNSRSKLDNVLFFRDEHDSGSLREEELIKQEEDDNDALSSTSAPPVPTHNRRPSTTSSIFLMPPPNMTMLLHDESAILPGSNRSSGDIHSINGVKLSASSVLPIPRTLKNNRETNHTASSNISVSPTENVSMVTGSPGSLFLRPEHEMLLGEMESLDLGRGERSEPEVWDE